jgi:hemerythrin-like domain-containing protein
LHSPIDFSSPAAGFDQPVDMWRACHQRVRRFSALAARLAAHIDEHGANEEAQITANSIRRYFNEAAPRHHEDEELDMFPRLRQRLSPRADAAVLAALESIEQEHLIMAVDWSALDVDLGAISRGEAVKMDKALIHRFEATYRQHIDVEEEVLLPAMQRLLSADDWDAIGRSMAERRGLDFNTLASR